jgi:hypothetical protein
MRLMSNFKAAKFICCFGPAGLLLPDETADLRLSDGLQERFQFLFGPFGRQFDAAVLQIANGAGDFKPMRQGSDRITEPDTLHPP